MFNEEERALIEPILKQKTHIVELPISSLDVDPSYQTRPRDRIVNQVANNFSEALLGTLKVSRRPDGSYWIIDGESRRQGLLRKGDKHRLLRCEVFETAGQRQEALLFAWFNSRRSREQTRLETNFKAYGVAGTDHGFNKAIEDCGFDLVGGGKGKHLKGSSWVHKAWELDGDGASMCKALRALKEAWKGLYQLHGLTILGVAMLYHSQRKAIDEQVRRALHRMPPDKLNDKVASLWTRGGGSARGLRPDEKPKLIATVLAKEINKNPGKSGKLDIGRLDEDRVGV